MRMSDDIRARAIRWMEDNWNNRREEVIDELMHPTCSGHLEGGEIKSRDEWRQARRELLTAFPDLRMKIEQSVVEGDTVVLRWRAVGTHDGDAMGLKRSGRKIEAVGSTWMKFADGKLVWGYDTWNQGALMASLV
jgi:predicted ester cyclase